MSAHASEPASPKLAHTLLSTPKQPTEPPSGIAHSDPEALKKALETGIQTSPDAFFRSGIVVAFSGLRQDDDRERGHEPEVVGQLPLRLITTHLKCPTLDQEAITTTTTFIIHPVHYTVFSAQNLLSSLMASDISSPLTRDEAVSRLDAVEVLPVFDFPAAAQAIGYVSAALREMTKDMQLQQQQSNNCRVVLVIAGLDTLVEGVIRASNPLKGAAVLGDALREVTALANLYGQLLSVVLVNTGGLGISSSSGGGDGGAVNQDYSLSALLPSLMQKTLDQGVDRHLLVSRVGKGSSGRVVNVIKDRVGAGLGMRYVC